MLTKNVDKFDTYGGQRLKKAGEEQSVCLKYRKSKNPNGDGIHAKSG